MPFPGAHCSDLYALLFEHFPPTRAVSASPLLTFPSSSCTLSTLKSRVDLAASALWSWSDLDVAEAVSAAREGDAEWPRAVVAVREQAQLDYAVVLLACLKVGIELVLVDSARAEDLVHLSESIEDSYPHKTS